MNLRHILRLPCLAGLAIVLVGGALTWHFTGTDHDDARLRTYVHGKPSVPIVFTSRSEPVSFVAAADEGEGFTYPGQRLWAAREGRLRILRPSGAVEELTWGKPLPDGNTLIDVMSPSISLDGKRILFAGRKDGIDAGRFRLYEIAVNGRGLRQLTGGPEDSGCTEAPPMRWRADRSLIPDAERRAVDYDDVDPIELNYSDRRIAFVSSRTPDLGRDHARRSTTLWVMLPDGTKYPTSANRNNDRWPFLLSSRRIAFSLWSRNREVISEDLRDIRPFAEGTTCATAPTDAWLGAMAQIPGGHFGMLMKPSLPVWRPRPLFANRIAFMTTLPGSRSALTVVQAPPGWIANAPSARNPEVQLPHSPTSFLRRSPDRDLLGRTFCTATPSPCPPRHILFAGASLREGANAPESGAYGLYIADDEWPEGDDAADAAAINMKLLFDDPELVDAEPVAVYERDIPLNDSNARTAVPATAPAELLLANGRAYRGPMGQILATALDVPTLMGDLPGQHTDAGQGPIFDAPPRGSIDHLRIYAARRDRFDDPEAPRIPGGWDRILTIPVKDGNSGTWAPTDSPTVLAGFDKEGRVVQWTTAAKDKEGRQANFYAYAGDHYSLTSPRGLHFCVGCHPGHSGLSSVHHDHAERARFAK